MMRRRDFDVSLAGLLDFESDLGKSCHLADSDVEIRARSELLELGTKPLSKAPRNDDLPRSSRPLLTDGFLDRFDRLFLGRFEKAAGVDDRQRGLFRGSVDGIPGPLEHPCDLLAVHLVLRAP